MLDLDKTVDLPVNQRFIFFIERPPRYWTYDLFEKYKSNVDTPPRKAKIKAMYKKAICDIKYSTSNGVKNETEGKEKAVNQYFNYGTHNGNFYSGDNLNIALRKRKHDDDDGEKENNDKENDYNDKEIDQDEIKVVDHNENLNSNSTEETDQTYHTESSTNYAEYMHIKKYYLTMNEITSYEDNNKEYSYDTSSSIFDRLNISYIDFPTDLPDIYKLKQIILNDEEYTQIRKWRMDIKNNQYYFPPSPTSLNQLQLNTLLCNITDTIFKERNEAGEKSEISFTIENIAPLFKFLFPGGSPISYKWDDSSHFKNNNDNGNINYKALRNDLTLFANDQEIGCGEIKLPGTYISLAEEVRARIAEVLKRQLHRRIISKEKKEFATFGMMINGYDIELYIMIFDENQNLPYKFYQVDNIKLPISYQFYTNLEQTIESLLSFKNTMISSLSDEDVALKPSIYQSYTHLFKPTLIFKIE